MIGALLVAPVQRSFDQAIGMYETLRMNKQEETAKMYKHRVHEKRNILDRVCLCCTMICF